MNKEGKLKVYLLPPCEVYTTDYYYVGRWQGGYTSAKSWKQAKTNFSYRFQKYNNSVKGPYVFTEKIKEV